MKRVILPLIILLIFLCACSKTQQTQSQMMVEISDKQNGVVATINSTETDINNTLLSASNIIVNEQSSGEKGMFYLGMSFENLNLLDLYNTDYEITSMNVIEENKDDWDYGHKVIWTPKLCLLFDTTESLYRITVNGDLPTRLELKNGDSITVLEKLYGKSYNRYDFDWGYVLEYNMGDHYFYVSVNEDIINLWGISKYKYNYNGD